MKKLFIGIFIITLSLNTFACEQFGDTIFIDGIKWVLLGKPIGNKSLYDSLKKVFPEDCIFSTNNYDGYIGYWSIKNEKLCLDSVKVTTYNQETKRYHDCSISSADMQRVFKKYYDKDEIIATWVKGTIRVARGKLLLYEEMAYERNYEQEQIITFKHGRIIERQLFHNRLVIDGFSLQDLWYQGQEEVKKKLPLKTDNYPELNDVKRICFNISPIQIDSLGNMVGNCKIEAFIVHKVSVDPEKIEKLLLHNRYEPYKIGKKIKGLGDEMKNLLKNIHPWRTYLINGQYISSYDREKGEYPYIIKD